MSCFEVTIQIIAFWIIPTRMIVIRIIATQIIASRIIATLIGITCVSVAFWRNQEKLYDPKIFRIFICGLINRSKMCHDPTHCPQAHHLDNL